MQPNGTMFIVARSDTPPADPVSSVALVPNGEWYLLVSNGMGWVPSWRDPMLAVVVLISALIGLLVGAVQVSRQMQKWLIKEMKVRGGWMHLTGSGT